MGNSLGDYRRRELLNIVGASEGELEIICPTNYVIIAPDRTRTTEAFCVAKYEMKNVNGAPQSQASDTPWVGLSRDYSASMCMSLGPGFKLISNSQWQTLAQNIENVASNWSSSRVGGSGYLNVGHSDNVPSGALPASSDDNDSCALSQETCDLSTWNAQRRTHKLPDGGVIWDVSGNVWEWVVDDFYINFGSDSFISQLSDSSHPNVAQVGDEVGIAKYHFGPSRSYGSMTSAPYGGLGYAWLNGFNSGAIVRGGNWDRMQNSGPFSVNLSLSPTVTVPVVGFRCVWTP